MVILSSMIALVAMPSDTVHAESLAGLSKYIDDFYDSGRRFYDDNDLHILSAVMQLENGGANDRCLLLTGSVVLNRVNSAHWPNTIHDVIFQGYPKRGQQYATHTVENIDTVKVSKHIKKLAQQLLIFGTKKICPENVVYQSMNPRQGSGNYEEINGEYFAYE